MKYINCEYEGSPAYNSVMGCSKQSLIFRTKYTEGAIKHHSEQGNEGQVKFFQAELDLINKRLKIAL